MYRYGQFCPIAAACEIFAERWTPLLLRELLVGTRRFNDLQRGLPLMSRTLLVQRLRELEAAGMIERVPKSRGRGFEYQLSRAGAELQPVIMQLGEWGRRWVYTKVSKEDLDPWLLMRDVQRRLHAEALPERRTVVQFEFRGVPRARKEMDTWWLVLERPDAELCLKDPGYDVDLLVSADLYALTRVWMGELDLKQAVRDGLVAFKGPALLIKAFPRWLKLSVFSGIQRPAAPARQIGSVR